MRIAETSDGSLRVTVACIFNKYGGAELLLSIVLNEREMVNWFKIGLISIHKILLHRHPI